MQVYKLRFHYKFALNKLILGAPIVRTDKYILYIYQATTYQAIWKIGFFGIS